MPQAGTRLSVCTPIGHQICAPRRHPRPHRQLHVPLERLYFACTVEDGGHADYRGRSQAEHGMNTVALTSPYDAAYL